MNATVGVVAPVAAEGAATEMKLAVPIISPKEMKRAIEEMPRPNRVPFSIFSPNILIVQTQGEPQVH